MAILKYTKADGTVVKLNSYKVNNLIPQQSKGDNPNAVMSQKAVTDELNAVGLQIDEVTGQITTINTDITEINNTLGECATSDALGELENIVSLKANKSEVYTKGEADGKFLTEHQDISGKADATALTDEVTRATTAEGTLTTSISDEVTRATTAEGELSDRVDALENVRIISCGTY